MPPHSLPMTMIGASLLWVGWFGFNAGSNLEANGVRSRSPSSTPCWRTAAAVWCGCSRNGCCAASPRCSVSLPGNRRGPRGGDPGWPVWSGRWARSSSGGTAGVVCLWGVTGLKKALGYDDSLDVFGIHGIGGIIGAIGTGIFVAPALGGLGSRRLQRCLARLIIQASAACCSPSSGRVWSAFVVLQAGRHDHRPARQRRARA
jgi:ammonium transporter, Amt family